MMRILSLSVAACLCFSVAVLGCGKGESPSTGTSPEAAGSKPAAAPAAPKAATKTMVASETVKAGCGKCMFNIDGVTSCKLAVAVEGGPKLVTGKTLELSHDEMCTKMVDVIIDGKIESDSFAATSIALVSSSK
jgi:hypothetical protein